MVRVFICTKMGQNMRGLGLKINSFVVFGGWSIYFGGLEIFEIGGIIEMLFRVINRKWDIVAFIDRKGLRNYSRDAKVDTGWVQ